MKIDFVRFIGNMPFRVKTVNKREYKHRERWVNGEGVKIEEHAAGVVVTDVNGATIVPWHRIKTVTLCDEPEKPKKANSATARGEAKKASVV